MDYRQAFVNRALDLIQTYRGNIPGDVKTIVKELGVSKTPGTLSSDEFNLLQETADKIDTQIRINQVQRSMRKGNKDGEQKPHVFEKPGRRR